MRISTLLNVLQNGSVKCGSTPVSVELSRNQEKLNEYISYLVNITKLAEQYSSELAELRAKLAQLDTELLKLIQVTEKIVSNMVSVQTTSSNSLDGEKVN